MTTADAIYRTLVTATVAVALLFLALAFFGCTGYRCAPNTERPGVTCVRR